MVHVEDDSILPWRYKGLEKHLTPLPATASMLGVWRPEPPQPYTDYVGLTAEAQGERYTMVLIVRLVEK